MAVLQQSLFTSAFLFNSNPAKNIWFYSDFRGDNDPKLIMDRSADEDYPTIYSLSVTNSKYNFELCSHQDDLERPRSIKLFDNNIWHSGGLMYAGIKVCKFIPKGMRGHRFRSFRTLRRSADQSIPGKSFSLEITFQKDYKIRQAEISSKDVVEILTNFNGSAIAAHSRYSRLVSANKEGFSQFIDSVIEEIKGKSGTVTID